jgi:hypothetical protein
VSGTRWRLLGIGCLLWPGLVAAQLDAPTERARIARERAAAEVRYDQQQRVCAERYFVTRCMDEARAEWRRVVDPLRREESVLDADERRRRAAARLAVIDQKVKEEARATALRGGQAGGAGGAVVRPDPAVAPGTATSPSPQQPTVPAPLPTGPVPAGRGELRRSVGGWRKRLKTRRGTRGDLRRCRLLAERVDGRPARLCW